MPDHEHDIDWELLDDYLAGGGSPAERARVEGWLARMPNGLVLEELREAATEIPPAPELLWQHKAEVRERLARTISQSARPRKVPDFILPRPSRRLTAMRIAAAALLAVGAGVAGRTLLTRETPVVAVEPRVYTTARGERAGFQLPDGSTVILGVASTLRVPGDFGDGRREVSLEGEAYFEVRHDERRPFVVRAGDLVAEDLGTEFVVRAYPDDPRARVVVREGEVKLHGAILHPGELGRLDPRGAPIVERIDPETYFAWTRGKLVLEGIPLEEALPDLSRWFDLDFRLADTSLGSIKLTAALTNDPSPEVLQSLAASLGVRQIRNGRTVTLLPALTQGGK